MARQFIYHMQDLSKSYSGGKKVLDGVHLSFYPDAKIGILGPNGAGKSTLLKIMAGLDTEFTGEAWVAEGATVGYLPQEPELDESKSVRENVMDGVADKKALLDSYNDISLKLAEDYTDKLMEEMSALQEQIEAHDLWDLDSRVDMAMGALRCPPDDAKLQLFRAVNAAALRCVVCCWKSRICCSLTNRPTISMPKRWAG